MAYLPGVEYLHDSDSVDGVPSAPLLEKVLFLTPEQHILNKLDRKHTMASDKKVKIAKKYPDGPLDCSTCPKL